VQCNLTGAQISCPSTCEGSETNRIPRKERIAVDPRCLSAAEASAWVRTSRVGLQLGCCLCIFRPIVNGRSGRCTRCSGHDISVTCTCGALESLCSKSHHT
jgi:hypothetical protein